MQIHRCLIARRHGFKTKITIRALLVNDARLLDTKSAFLITSSSKIPSVNGGNHWYIEAVCEVRRESDRVIVVRVSRCSKKRAMVKQMKRIVFVTIGLAALALRMTAQPTENVITRVFQIRYSGLMGTAFVIDYDDSQYFVTADHMVKDAGKRSAVEVFGSGDARWHSFDF